MDQFKIKCLLIGYESLNTPNGVASFLKEINKMLPSKVVTIRNFFNKLIEDKELNLKARTVFNEIIYIRFNSLTNLIRNIKSSNIIHLNIDNLFTIPLSFIALYFKKSIISGFHSFIRFKNNKFKQMLENLRVLIVNNFLVLVSKKIIFLTNSQNKSIKKYIIFKKCFENKSIIINNFIDGSIIKKGKNTAKFNLLFVGRYTKFKGFEDLINVARDMRNVNFSLIGDDLYKSRLKNVTNIGTIENSKIYKEYDKHSIFILPSYTEAFPMTILEAMARGLVILVSDIPGMREIIKEGRNGYLFQPGDLNKMKEIILYLKNNPSEIKRISKNNLKDIWKFTAEKQIPKYLKLYKEVLRDAKK